MAVLERFKRESMYGLSSKKVAIVEKFKQESMYGLSFKKSGHCREISSRVNVWTVLQKKWPL